MAEDRALPNLKARLSIDTSDAERAKAAVQQARGGIQGMASDANAASDAARAAAAQATSTAAATSEGLSSALRSSHPILEQTRGMVGSLSSELLALAGVDSQVSQIAQSALSAAQGLGAARSAAGAGEGLAGGAAAATGLAAAEGTAATAAAALAAALGPIGVLGATALATAALAQMIEVNHDVKESTVDFTKALLAQKDASTVSIDTLSAQALAATDAARQASAAGVSYADMFAVVRNGGPELDAFTGALKSSGGSVGVAIDYLNRAGASTDAFGQRLIALLQSGKLNVDQVTALAEALAGLSDKFHGDKTDADALKEALSGLAVESDNTAEAAKRLEAATNLQASAGASLLTSQSSVASAEDRVRQAKEKLANFGTQATAKSVREQRDEARAVEAAAARIVDAQQHIIDARQKVADAQEALAHAGEHERLDVQDAQDEVDRAQRLLNASSPEERGPAQHALEDAQQRLVDAKRALDDARPDAERALADAVRGVEDAMRSEADAHQALTDAQDKQAESSQKATDRQGDYRAAVDDVTTAQLALAQAQAQQMDLMAQLAGRVDGPVSKLGNLKAALRAVADELDPNSDLTKRVLYVLASLGGVVLPEIQIATPGEFKQSARGNHLAAFEPSWVGDKFGMDRAELFVPDVPGRIVPQVAGGGFGGPQGDVTNHYHQYQVTVNSSQEAPERSIRRELERFAMLAAR